MRNYYAGRNYYGTNCTYDSDGWTAYRFSTKRERDEFVRKNLRNINTGNLVAEAITREAARKITGANMEGYFYDQARYAA